MGTLCNTANQSNTTIITHLMALETEACDVALQLLLTIWLDWRLPGCKKKKKRLSTKC